MNNIIIVGAGGHGLSVLEVIEAHGDYKCVGFLDDNKDLGFNYFDYSVLGRTNDAIDIILDYSTHTDFIVAIGNNKKREELFHKLRAMGATFPGIVSKDSITSYRYSIGEGTIVMSGAYIGPGVNIGDNCIINTKAIVEHDVQIGNNCHIASGAIIVGGKKICDDVTVGAGAVVTKDITTSGTYIGVPAKKYG